MQSKRIIGTTLLLLLIVFLLALAVWKQDHYLWVSLGVFVISFLMLLIRFEKRKVEPRELVLLAVLAAIAAAGRIPFAGIPNVQPTTFVIMMSGFVFGAESGFMIGTVAALVSNMILGQGPWTPWQMAAWGLVGFTAGLLRRSRLMNSQWGRIVFAIIWGFLFGWIMNIWAFFSFTQDGNVVSIKAFLTFAAGSAIFDSMHAVSNVIFLIAFGGIWIKILTRFKRKYGLLE